MPRTAATASGSSSSKAIPKTTPKASSNDRLLLAKAIKSYVTTTESLHKIVENIQDITENTFVEYDLHLESKKAEYKTKELELEEQYRIKEKELKEQYEDKEKELENTYQEKHFKLKNKYETERIETEQKLDEFKHEEALKILEEYDEDAISSSDLKHLKEEIEDLKDSFDEKVEKEVAHAKEQARKEYQYKTTEQELKHKAEIADYTAENKMLNKEIESLKDALHNMRQEVAAQRMLCKDIAESHKANIHQSFEKRT